MLIGIGAVGQGTVKQVFVLEGVTAPLFQLVSIAIHISSLSDIAAPWQPQSAAVHVLRKFMGKGRARNAQPLSSFILLY